MKWWAKKWKSTQWQTREICKYDYSFASFTTVGGGFSSLFRLARLLRALTLTVCWNSLLHSFVDCCLWLHFLSFSLSWARFLLLLCPSYTRCVWFLPIFLPPHTAEFTNNRRSSHARFSHHLLFSFIDFIRRKATTSCRWDEAGGRRRDREETRVYISK